jgi:hypothetical protein
MVFCHKKAEQKRFPVYENIFLVAAASPDEAFAKAEKLGRAEEGDDVGSLRVAGRLSIRRCAGVRKIVECLLPDERPRDETELTYNELEFASLRDVERFARGYAVAMKCGSIRPPKNSGTPSAGQKLQRGNKLRDCARARTVLHKDGNHDSGR